MVSRFSKVLTSANKGCGGCTVALTGPRGLDSQAPALQGLSRGCMFHPVITVSDAMLLIVGVVLKMTTMTTGWLCWDDLLQLQELIPCCLAVGQFHKFKVGQLAHSPKLGKECKFNSDIVLL